jgi:hypothetical protein
LQARPGRQRAERHYRLAYVLGGPGLYTVFGRALARSGRRLLVGAPAPLGGDSYAGIYDAASGATLGVQSGLPFDSEFGTAIAVSRRSIAFGAPAIDDDRGGVFLLDRGADSPRALPAPEGYHRVGGACAWVGRRLAVGAVDVREATPFVDEIGVVLLLDAETGALVRAIPSPRPAEPGDFGHSTVSVPGGFAVASPGYARTGDAPPGLVHLFDRTGRLVRTLERPVSVADDGFGLTLASAGNLLLVGSPSPRHGSAAYLFVWRQGSWTLERSFVSPESSFKVFGASVALDRRRALIGDPLAEAAYLFDLTTGDLLATLRPPPSPDPELPPFYPRSAFGSTVAIAGRTLVVAAPRVDENEQGYVFGFLPDD